MRAPDDGGAISSAERQPILDALGNLQPCRPESINISALHPHSVQDALAAFFTDEMDAALNADCAAAANLPTFAQIDAEIVRREDAPAFWDHFKEQRCRTDDLILLHSLGEDVFNRTFVTFQETQAARLEGVIRELRTQRNALITTVKAEIAQISGAILQETIAAQTALLPSLSDNINSYNLNQAQAAFSRFPQPAYFIPTLEEAVRRSIQASDTLREFLDEPEKQNLFEAFLPDFMGTTAQREIDRLSESMNTRKASMQERINALQTQQTQHTATTAATAAIQPLQAQIASLTEHVRSNTQDTQERRAMLKEIDALKKQIADLKKPKPKPKPKTRRTTRQGVTPRVTAEKKKRSEQAANTTNVERRSRRHSPSVAESVAEQVGVKVLSHVAEQVSDGAISIVDSGVEGIKAFFRARGSF